MIDYEAFRPRQCSRHGVHIAQHVGKSLEWLTLHLLVNILKASMSNETGVCVADILVAVGHVDRLFVSPTKRENRIGLV